MTTTATARYVPPEAALRGAPRRDRRWLILATIGIAQLMVVLDVTIVNIALPSAQRDLGFGSDGRQWVITTYALAFGSLLLLGGRLSDLIGRRATLLIGLLGFAGASAVGGAAPNFALLVAARALQGMFAAGLAPAALSTLNVTFTEAKDRARAFGIYSAIAAGGSVVGLIIGGILTEWLSWRWCLYVNLLFAVPAAMGVVANIHDSGAQRRVRLDLPGVLTAAGGLFCLVYGLSHAEQHGWRSTLTWLPLVASAVLLVGFVLIERVVTNPLLPVRVIKDRNRAGSYLSIALAFGGMFGAFLFMTYFLQQALRYSPLMTGVAFLPVTAGLMISAGLSNTKLVPRFGPRPLVPVGFLVGGAALAWLAQLSASSSYAHDVLGPLFVLGLGVGLVFAPSLSTATAGIAVPDAGVGSAMVSTSQQIGGAVGTAVLSTVFSTALANYVSAHQPAPGLQPTATIHGYTAAFSVSAAIFVAGAVLAGALLRSSRLELIDAAGVAP